MGLLDWAAGVRATPGLGAGLLGGDWNADPTKNDAVRKALMAAGFGMLSSRGSFAQGLGQAGMAGMGAYDQTLEDKRRQDMQAFQFDQAKQQAEQQRQVLARQQRLDALPAQFMRPGGGMAVDATGGMETAVDAPQNVARTTEPQFDMPGYLTALKSIDPIAAIQLEASMAKQGPKRQVVGPGSALVDESTGKPIYTAPFKPETQAKPSAVQEYEYAKQQGYQGTFEQFDRDRRRAGATNIGMPKIELKTGEGLASQVGPMLKGTKDQALAGLRLIDSSNRVLDAAEKGGLFAGPGANLMLRGAQVADVLGFAGKNTQEKIANTRSVVRGMAEQAVSARAQLGGQAQISNAEQELINRATAGDITDLTAGEIVQIAQLNDRLGRQLYSLHQDAMNPVVNNPNLSGLAPFYQVPPIPPARPSRPKQQPTGLTQQEEAEREELLRRFRNR